MIKNNYIHRAFNDRAGILTERVKLIIGKSHNLEVNSSKKFLGFNEQFSLIYVYILYVYYI